MVKIVANSACDLSRELAEQYWLRNSPSHLTEEVQQDKISYTLEFFDADGQVILTQTNP